MYADILMFMEHIPRILDIPFPVIKMSLYTAKLSLVCFIIVIKLFQFENYAIYYNHEIKHDH